MALEQYDKALADADECIRLQPTWAKGYSRRGAALFRMDKLGPAAGSKCRLLASDDAGAPARPAGSYGSGRSCAPQRAPWAAWELAAASAARLRPPRSGGVPLCHRQARRATPSRRGSSSTATTPPTCAAPSRSCVRRAPSLAPARLARPPPAGPLASPGRLGATDVGPFRNHGPLPPSSLHRAARQSW